MCHNCFEFVEFTNTGPLLCPFRPGAAHLAVHQAGHAAGREETVADDPRQEAERHPRPGRRCVDHFRGDARRQNVRDGPGDHTQHGQSGGHAVPEGEEADVNGDERVVLTVDCGPCFFLSSIKLKYKYIYTKMTSPISMSLKCMQYTNIRTQFQILRGGRFHTTLRLVINVELPLQNETER